MDREDKNSPKKSTLKVVPLPQKEKGKRDKFRIIHDQIVDAMIGNHGRLPPFPVRYHRWIDHEGNSLIYREDPGAIVRRVSDEDMHHEIAKYWNQVSSEYEVFWGPISADDTVKTKKLWIIRAAPTRQNFIPLAFKNEPRLALKKVDFSPSQDDQYTPESLKYLPCYQEIMARMSDSHIFMAWVGSLFDPRSQRQQYAWVYGEGGDGKGAMIRAISGVLGCAAKAVTPYDGSRFWTFGLQHKRLLIFADCEDSKMVTSGIWKMITGEDSVPVEKKQGASYDVELDAKCLLTSNKKPEIHGTRADLRRALIFRISGHYRDFGADYESRLRAETPAFLLMCYKFYQDLSGGNPRFEFKLTESQDGESEATRIADENERDFEVFASDYIYVSESKDEYITGRRMKEIMVHAEFKTHYERSKLVRYLERKHGIVYSNVKCRSTGKWTKAWIKCTEPKPYTKS